MALLANPILGAVVDSNAVLDVVGPLPDVFVAVREDHSALALALARLELALVDTAVGEGQFTLSVEEVVLELALVSALGLREVVHACTELHANFGTYLLPGRRC